SVSSAAPRAVPSADGGETPGPVISPPRFRGSDELAPGMARLYLNLGRKDGASERDVLDLLSTHATMSRPPELDIMNTHTYINVPADDAGRVCEALTGKELAGRALVCEPAKPRRR
ncbi:MAG TPA: DbpA RNA binding domain-containing protein, partial [Polyangia bacterium]|nr:DbpA RNA binding domain-containing protein [Polyangia bacterium]